MTYIGTARLEADDLDPFVLTIEHGFAVAALDLGFPSIRAVVSNNPDRNGEDDRTEFFGARAVVLAGTIVPTPTATRQAVLDRLATFLHPARRPWLIYELEPGSGERRIRLRPDQHSRPIIRPGSAAITVGWRGPDGVQESTTESETIILGWPGGEEGRTYDLTFDRIYPDSPAIGIGTVNNPGTLDVAPELVIVGPVTNPRVRNVTTGERIEFTDLTLDAGDELVIDMAERTALENGDVDRRPWVDDAATVWWSLHHGDNEIAFTGDSIDTGATLTVRFRPAWI